MENILYAIKVVELLVLEVFVVGATVAVSIACLYEIVRDKVRESRQADQVAPEATVAHRLS